ncbi:hypothetical protein AABB24_021833 [Solanum stoloniferum]|uniref:Uncharacterized protein n=1 Tax=Solanum stoloniferum TaxID=62892 RepID=A0ABD2SWQ0_9SOLN
MRPSMRPTGQQPADKGKGITQPDTYAQTLLGRQNFRPLSTIDNLMERIYFETCPKDKMEEELQKYKKNMGMAKTTRIYKVKDGMVVKKIEIQKDKKIWT